MSQETLERELARRAEDVQGTPFSFADVRARATSIRRRRRAAVAGAVAAAVALVVLVPTVLTGGSGTKSDAPDPAPPAPGHTAVLHDGTLTLPDGSTVRLDVDNADVTELGLLTDGRIVLAMQRPYVVRVYTPDGTLQQEYAVLVNALTMSTDDSAVAWVGGADDSDRGVRVLASGVPEPTVLPGIPAAGEFPGSVSAVLGPQRVLADGGYGTDTLLTPDGAGDLRTSEPLTVTDVSPDGGLWAVQYEDDSDPQFGCVGLYDPQAREMVARSCDTAGLRFSPGGQHLLGLRGDNNMYGDATVLDLDLREVGRWESPGEGDVISRAAWTDAGHLLVARTNWRTGTWSLERVGLDWGEAETLVQEGPGRNPERVEEFLLSE